MKYAAVFSLTAAIFLPCNVSSAQIVGALPAEETTAEDAKTLEEASAPATLTTVTTETTETVAPQGTSAEVDVSAQPLDKTSEPESDGTAQTAEVEEINEDEIADKLNSMQQLQQKVILTRTINGEVEREERTVTYSRDNPVRATEAGQTKLEALKNAFDQEVLTRVEALEEAKLDFLLADKNRDNAMSAIEFIGLVETWRDNNSRDVESPTDEIARQRQYSAFLTEIDPDTAYVETKEKARLKFAFMAGAAQTLNQKEYIAEYLTDFDAMDDNKDTILKKEELLRFRAANRGETMRVPVEPVTSTTSETEQ